MPTWMMHREVYTASEEIGRLRRILRVHTRAVGGFVEGPGVSEDLVFFYQHVARGGTFSKVDDVSRAFHPHIRSFPHALPPRPSWCTAMLLPPLHSRFPRSSSCKYVHTGTSAPLPRLFLPQLAQVRADAFQSIILAQRGWDKFSIWGCGRDGKRFFNLLSRENKQKVRRCSCVNAAAPQQHVRHSRRAGGHVC